MVCKQASKQAHVFIWLWKAQSHPNQGKNRALCCRYLYGHEKWLGSDLRLYCRVLCQCSTQLIHAGNEMQRKRKRREGRRGCDILKPENERETVSEIFSGDWAFRQV
ncbi:hypothetical protein VNO78_08720 [Psophocarpus tetragonolobus]|uniref:Uncharacterized protein n=1 Tax=Psophocarpus tetragonolobus TaxID=3891 RepID=A0AAN9XTN1_PSOTE